MIQDIIPPVKTVPGHKTHIFTYSSMQRKYMIDYFKGSQIFDTIFGYKENFVYMNITHFFFFILSKSAYIVQYFIEDIQIPGVLVLYCTRFFGSLIISGQIKIRFNLLKWAKNYLSPM